jgi:ABC-type branched-subunit amino acid transport system ATPase component
MSHPARCFVAVNEGEAATLFGHNGTKNSTTRSAARQTFYSANIGDMPPHEIAWRVLRARTSQHLSFAQGRRKLATRARKDLPLATGRIYRNIPCLNEQRTNRNARLFGGEQPTRLIGRALMNHPRLLVLVTRVFCGSNHG